MTQGSYKPARLQRVPLLLALLAAVAVAVVLAAGAAGGAGGTFAERHTAVTDLGHGAYGVDTQADNHSSVVPLGDVDLAATGVNTKTLTVGTPSGLQGCGNASINWDDLGSGSSYKVTQQTTWNAPGDCGTSGGYHVFGAVNNVDMWANDGTHTDTGTLPQGSTDVWSRDSTGTATTKTNWQTNDGSNFCGYLAAGSSGYWAVTICSV